MDLVSLESLSNSSLTFYQNLNINSLFKNQPVNQISMEKLKFSLSGYSKVSQTFSILITAVILTLSFQGCELPIDEIAQNTNVQKKGVVKSNKSIVYWGPEKYVRTTGEVNVFKVEIGNEDLVHFEPEFTFQLKNGDGKKNLVSSAIVKVDGKEVFGVSDFSQAVKSLSKSISGISENSVLEVEVRGIPGSFIEVWIEGKLLPGHALIAASGGELISIDGLVKLTFPEGAVDEPLYVSIVESNIDSPEITNCKSIGPSYDLLPDGRKFDKEILVIINYQNELPFINNLENIGVFHWNNNYKEIVSGTNDQEKFEIQFTINHFSSIQTIESPEGWAVYNCYWIINKIKWYLEIPSPPSYLKASNIQYALDLWQNETSSFVFERTYDKNEANIIFYESYDLPYLIAADCASGVLTRTIFGVTCFDAWTNYFEKELTSEDYITIRIASNDIPNTQAAITTIAHEIGHALGLAHQIVESPTSVMSSGVMYQNDLTDLDKAALHYHYKPANSNTFVDSRDGKEYKTIKIGDQVWMAENLAYLPSVSPSSDGSETDPYYYVYDYQGTDVAAAKETDNYKTYGVLYNWPAAMAGATSSNSNPSKVQGVCPAGWHLPSDAEWTQLGLFLIANGYNYDGTTSGNKIAKSMAAPNLWYKISNTGVIGDNLSLNNRSGFSALPGGYRGMPSGNFVSLGFNGAWWSCSENDNYTAWYRGLSFNAVSVSRIATIKSQGFSVRCIKN
jgi:uncharacterized protein (TIGR02145 family)